MSETFAPWTAKAEVLFYPKILIVKHVFAVLPLRQKWPVVCLVIQLLCLSGK